MKRFTVKQAKEITGGGVQSVSKMDKAKTYNLPPSECLTGNKLKEIEGSVCSDCYAEKGLFAVFHKTVQPAQYRRLESLEHPKWSQAMAFLINRYSHEYFRWLSAGDVPNVEFLMNVHKVATLTPDTRHWLPTREYRIVKKYKALVGATQPENLVIRLSAHMVNGQPPSEIGLPTSTVHTLDHQWIMANSHICPANSQGNTCWGKQNGGIDCHACWSPVVQNVSYIKH